jgi:hypothetical protein
MVATFMLRVLGYEDNWETAIEDAAELGIINDVMNDEFVREDAFDMMYDTLLIPRMGSDVPLGVELGVMDEEDVMMVEDVDIENAKAINEMVIEVELNEDIDAPEAVDESIFTVMDEDDEEIEVMMAEFAGWDSDNYTVLVWLEDDLTAGELYTIMSGDSSANFGGKNRDTTDPEVKDVTSTDFDEVTVEFSEPVVLETVKAEFAEKYGDKDELAVLDIYYDSRTEIVFKTEDQQDATLYTSDISGAEDFAGNEMDADDENTFVGKEKPDDDLMVEGAKSNDYDEVSVRFNVRVDPTTVDPENFMIKEKYGDKDELAVLSAEVAVDDEEYYGKDKIEDLTEDDNEKYVILMTESQDDATLYELTVEDVESLYGESLDSDEDTVTFVGQEKPDDELTFDVESISNTEVEVDFSENVDPTTVDISDFEIAEKYGDKDDLAILDLEIDDDLVTLTTESQDEATLYEIEINDIEDEYGNPIDTGDDENIKTFVGNEVADAIEKIEKINRTTSDDLDDPDTQIRVIFDQKVGDNAENVAYYFIDEGIGYPEDAMKDSDDKFAVILTIPETTEGKIYELTVREGLENSDGIESTDELTKTFAGRGEESELPTIEAVMATDNQTLKIYFDRDVEDDYIDGQIWNSDTNRLISGALGISLDEGDGVDQDLAGLTEYAYQPDDEETALVVRVAEEETFSDSNVDGDVFKLIGDEDKVYSDDDDNILEFAYNDDDPDFPYLEAAQMMDRNTIRLYFSEPVKIDDETLIIIAEDEDGDDEVTFVKLAVSDDDIVWDMSLNDSITDLPDDKGFVVFDDEAVTDISGTIDSDDEGEDYGGYTSVEFGADYDQPDELDDIFAVMMDNRTIKVYYPEDMNEEDVIDIDNYAILDKDSSNPDNAVLGGDVFFDRAEYDDDEFTATLYLMGDITTYVDFDDYFLAVDGDVQNALLNNSVEDEYSNILGEPWLVFEFAADDDDPDAPELMSAKVSDDRYTLTIKFNEDVYFADADDTDPFDPNDSLVDGLSKSELLDALNITAEFENEDEEGPVTSAEIYAVMDKDVDDEDEIKIEFNVPLKANSTGTITTEDADDEKILNRADIAAETDDDASEISFGVAPSLYPSDVRPEILEAHVDSMESDEVDTITLMFSKAVDDSTVDVDDFTFDGELTFVSASGVNEGGEFEDVVDDEYLVFEIDNYLSGTGVTADFEYDEGTLEGMNGKAVMSQTIQPEDIFDHVDPMVASDGVSFLVAPVTSHDISDDGEVDTIAVVLTEPVMDSTIDIDAFTSDDYIITQDTPSWVSGLDTVDDQVIFLAIESDNGPLGTGEISDLVIANNAVDDHSGNGLAGSTESVVDMAGPVVLDVMDNQLPAETTFLAGDTDDEITVTLANENGTNLLGAYGNEFDIELVELASDSDTTASTSGTTLTIELGDTGGVIDATVNQVVSAIDGVDGFTASVSTGDGADAAIETTSTFSGGVDEIDVEFSEALAGDSLDDLATDMDISTVTNESEALYNLNVDTIEIDVDVADAQVFGETLTVTPSEITDSAGNEVNPDANSEVID